MTLNGLLNKIRAVVRRRRLDEELEDEIQSHLAMAVEDYVGRGMSRQEAEITARRDFGSVERVRENHRDVRAFVLLENVLQDLKFGARGLRKRPGFALTVFVALALGIGLPALTFSLIRSALLTQLPFEGADRIMRVDRTGEAPVTAVDYATWTARQRSFERLGAVQRRRVSLGIENRGTEPVSGAAMTPAVLSLLSVQPALGRPFTEADAAPGAPPVVLLGHTVWRDRMESDPAVLGSDVRVNGSQAQVVGIMPEGFGFPSDQQMWSPLAIDPLRGHGADTGAADERVSVVGLLREGVSAQAAAAELTALTSELDAGDAAPAGPSSQVSVRNYTDMFDAPGASAALAALMLGAALMVLLVACANVANVLLARTVARRREVAVRVAIGASRLRIASQLWAEVFLLAAAGAAGGVGIALVVIRFIDGLLPPGMPFWVDFSLDPSVLAFVAFVAVLAALLAGVVPVVHAAGANTQDVLKDDARGSSSFRLGRVMRRLIGVELALSFVLLVCAGLFIRSAANYYGTDFAFEPEDVYIARISLPEAYGDLPTRARFVDELRRSIGSLPQVEGAVLTNAIPGVGSAPATPVELERDAGVEVADLARIPAVTLTPGFFELFRTPLLAGRDFDDRDQAGRLPVAIVNAAFAETHFPEGALNQRIRLPGEAGEEEWRTIVGVAPDLGVDRLEPAVAQIYLPVAQTAPPNLIIVARPVAAFESLPAPIRETLMSIDPDVPLYSVQAHDVAIDLANAQWKWMSILFSVSGGAALFLAAIGLYGVMSFWVVQRTREIGVRMALGGQRGEIVRLVLRQGMAQTSIGLIAGVLLAIPIARLLRFALFGVAPYDPIVFAGIFGVLMGVAWLACWFPARYATRIDPLRALSSE